MSDSSQQHNLSGDTIRNGISENGVEFIQKLVDLREEFMNNIEFSRMAALEKALKDAALDLTSVAQSLGIQPTVARAKHRASGGMYKDGLLPPGTPRLDMGMFPN